MILTQSIFQASAKQRKESNVSFRSDMARKQGRLALWRGIKHFGAQRAIRLMDTTKHGESVISVRVE